MLRIEHIESHMSRQEAEQRGVSIAAWTGNAIADDLAGTAAKLHEIPKAKMACYDWIRATSCLVRERIAQAHIELFDGDFDVGTEGESDGALHGEFEGPFKVGRARASLSFCFWTNEGLDGTLDG